MLSALIVIVLFIFGTFIGSFISVVMYRLHHQKKGILKGRSMCPQCQMQLKAADLIPIVSYLSLRGKCRYCNKEISYMYPLLEVITGLLFVALFTKFPFIDAQLQISPGFSGLYLLFAFYIFILVFTFFYDLHYYQVSDEILLPGVMIALIATIAAPYTPNLPSALLGIVIAVGFFGLQIILSKGKWLGMGDLRIGAFMGAILGWQFTLLALVLSYIVGSIVSLFIIIKKKKMQGVKVPFAPFLVTGTLIAIFFGDQILSWYFRGIGI